MGARRAREHLVAGQAAQARDVGRIRGEEGHVAAQLLPRCAQQVAQVGPVRAAVAVLVLDLRGGSLADMAPQTLGTLTSTGSG